MPTPFTKYNVWRVLLLAKVMRHWFNFYRWYSFSIFYVLKIILCMHTQPVIEFRLRNLNGTKKKREKSRGNSRAYLTLQMHRFSAWCTKVMLFVTRKNLIGSGELLETWKANDIWLIRHFRTQKKLLSH